MFIAVADELHFGRAAERLHLTQPAVSGQIRQLEQELDVRLLDRSARHVALTEAGQLLLDDAQRIIRQADAACMSVRSWRAGAGSRLRVGYVASSPPRTLPAALHEMGAAAGAPNVQLTTGASRALISQIRDETLDVAIVSLPAPVTGLHVVPLGHEHAAVAVRVGRFDGRERDVPIEIVSRSTVLTVPRRMNPALHDAGVAAFRTVGLPSPLVEIEDATPEQLVLQVAAGAGMALVAESVVDRVRIPGVAFRRLASVQFETAVITAVPERGELTNAFVGALTRAARRHPAPERAERNAGRRRTASAAA